MYVNVTFYFALLSCILQTFQTHLNFSFESKLLSVVNLTNTFYNY